jgi:predicted lipase
MDIGDDADLRLTDWNGGQVHAGFLRALDQVGVAIDTAVNSINIPILFTGHSLGAALATLAASLYRPSGKVTALYTFGSPRVGNSEFATTLQDTDVYRYRDCCDVVTRVPPPAMGYAHVGGELYIDRNGLISENPSEEFVADDQIAAEGDYLSGTLGVQEMLASETWPTMHR